MMKNSAITGATCVLLLFITGCSNVDQLPDKVTFTEHVAPILYNNCTICHSESGGAHFRLVTWTEAQRTAAALAYVTKERLMPPWPADAHYTEFIGQRGLTEREIKIIAKWITDGTTEGPKDKMPPLPHFPQGSLAGEPDMRIAVQPYFLKSNSADQFLLVKVPFELPADTFASLIEFVPGNRRVVHHVNGDMVKYDFSKKNNVFAGEQIVNMEKDTDNL
ncbi:MAG: hypothetical protein H7257_05970, partial [Taibaiella sp.]|nr:hypothetical protein [Taibaiella sp.]